MTIPRCSIPAPRCGYEGAHVQCHHVLTRDELGRYVEPVILLPLCSPDCHQGGVHRLLAAAGLDAMVPVTHGIVVGRIAVTLGWLGLHRSGDVAVPASFLAGLADVLGPIGHDLRRCGEGSA